MVLSDGKFCQDNLWLWARSGAGSSTRAGALLSSSRQATKISASAVVGWSSAGNLIRFGAMDAAKPYKFIGFGAMDATKPYKCIGFGAIAITKPHKFIGFGAIAITTPYK